MYESIQLRRVDRSAEFAVGDFCFERHENGKVFFVMRLPGQWSETAWPVVRMAKVDGPCSNPGPWNWDGNEEKPTLRPSLHHVGVWHGFVENGFARSVGPA